MKVTLLLRSADPITENRKREEPGPGLPKKSLQFDGIASNEANDALEKHQDHLHCDPFESPNHGSPIFSTGVHIPGHGTSRAKRDAGHGRTRHAPLRVPVADRKVRLADDANARRPAQWRFLTVQCSS